MTLMTRSQCLTKYSQNVIGHLLLELSKLFHQMHQKSGGIIVEHDGRFASMNHASSCASCWQLNARVLIGIYYIIQLSTAKILAVELPEGLCPGNHCHDEFLRKAWINFEWMQLNISKCMMHMCWYCKDGKRWRRNQLDRKYSGIVAAKILAMIWCERVKCPKGTWHCVLNWGHDAMDVHKEYGTIHLSRCWINAMSVKPPT